jgi:hypothetical protein
MRERLPPDGYEIFVPDETLYDLSRARENIRAMARARSETWSGPARTTRAVAAPFPALDWLDEALTEMRPTGPVLLAFMPVHASLLPPPGSEGDRREMACKTRAAELGQKHNATVLDFRFRSPVTVDDANYWDGLHYRIGIAARIADGLSAAFKSGRDDPAGFYRVLNPRRQ